MSANTIPASNVAAHSLYSTLHDSVSDVYEVAAGTFQLVDGLAIVPLPEDTLGSDLETLGDRMLDCNEAARFLFRVPTHGDFESLHGRDTAQDVRRAIDTIQTCVNDDRHQTSRVLTKDLRTLMGLMTGRLNKEVGLIDATGSLHTPEWDLAELTEILRLAPLLDSMALTTSQARSTQDIPSVAIAAKVGDYLAYKVAEVEPGFASARLAPGLGGRLRHCVATGRIADEMSSVEDLAARIDVWELSQMRQ